MIERLRPPVADRDLDDLAALLLDAVEGNASVGFGRELSREEARRWWETRSPDVLLVARSDGRIAGTGQLQFSSYPNGRHRAEVAKVLVHSASRRQGIATALMEALESEALRASKSLLVLDTESGSGAELLYRRLGWTEVGSIPAFARRADGELRPTTFFYKRLSF